MHPYYKLDENKNAIPCTSTECSDQLEEMIRTHTKHVAQDYIDGKRISTVWLGMNHNWSFFDDAPPIVFETMVFENEDSGYDIYSDRYSTWKEAEAGHKKAIEWVKEGCKQDE